MSYEEEDTCVNTVALKPLPPVSGEKSPSSVSVRAFVRERARARERERERERESEREEREERERGGEREREREYTSCIGMFMCLSPWSGTRVSCSSS